MSTHSLLASMDKGSPTAPAPTRLWLQINPKAHGIIMFLRLCSLKTHEYCKINEEHEELQP